ncbi:hypothetical protein BO79DRAFT_228637 [Aspergillus costaricaensis CBS 115574]|uniref:Uncharacterized protein n=1 Tax=Aspergillus costaricaensis CBS 115574 TaxID=1448317 RepID=A0ACD1IE30_9EURO|nr:hypothetical protein BO79DRAFT_228637 [Aspergillus costaricaensis CBS 115574]RAK88605.1 hypothetical protein BO79DRAFT_228637 [Aspergillus costaricaensis CBS 115574]
MHQGDQFSHTVLPRAHTFGLGNTDTFLPHIQQLFEVKGVTSTVGATYEVIDTNDPIRTGERLMADLSYAVLPTLAVGSSNDLIYCNLGCSRRVSRHAASRVTCETGWSLDVCCCNESCKDEGQARHDFGCVWLKKYRPVLPQEPDAHDYYMPWIVVLLLAARYLELQGTTPTNLHQQSMYQYFFVSGWKSIQPLRDNRDSRPPSQIQHWSTLAETYLLQAFFLPQTLDLDTLFDLICAHETSVSEKIFFYTMIIPHQSPGVQRGKQYGPAVFLRITLANHSCAPNELFTFTCTCPRCLQDEQVQNLWDAFCDTSFLRA